MQDLILPTFNEIVAIAVSVILGTAAYLGYTVVFKKRKLNKGIVFMVLLMNSLITFAASEGMKMWNFGAYRTVFLPLIAYAGQYLFDWFDKRNMKVFDAAAGKIGIDVKEDKDEEHID